MAEDPIPTTVVNEAVSADNVRALARPNQRSLHAVLCGALINTQALVTRLELGVQVSDARRGAVVKAK